jgi:aminoglycoside phosphotransferase (APT) family kinase protein
MIVKASAGSRESRFYHVAASALRDIGVRMPRMEFSAHVGDRSWLVLEDVPHPLPRDHWVADAEMLALLSRLHRSTFGRPLELPGMYAPEWTDGMTDAALSCFTDEVAGSLVPALAAVQRESRRLFEPWCSISGDPNPTNWGVCEDGSLVLYDWERFGAGAPALDLAITIPGLGYSAAYAAVATLYLQQWRRAETVPVPELFATLPRDIGIAKAWSVVEFLSLHARGGLPAAHEPVRWLVDQLPQWLCSLEWSAKLIAD